MPQVVPTYKDDKGVARSIRLLMVSDRASQKSRCQDQLVNKLVVVDDKGRSY